MGTHLLQEWQKLIRRPTNLVESVEFHGLDTSILHNVDGRAAAQDASAGDDDFAVREGGLRLADVVEDLVVAAAHDVHKPEERVGDGWVVEVAPAALNEQDGEVRERIAQSRGEGAASSAACMQVSVN